VSVSETAYLRAKRRYWQVVTSDKWAWLVLAVAGLAGTGAGIYLSWGHGRDGTIAWSVVCLAVGLVVALSLIFIALWVTGPTRQRDEARMELEEVRPDAGSGDERPISVRIDRDPIWHNFNYEAHIIEVHVVMTNQTDTDKNIAGTTWIGGQGTPSGNPEIRREVDRLRKRRPSFLRHSIIEAGATESGWAVNAFPFGTESAPDLPTFSVTVVGYKDAFEAWYPKT